MRQIVWGNYNSWQNIIMLLYILSILTAPQLFSVDFFIIHLLSISWSQVSDDPIGYGIKFKSLIILSWNDGFLHPFMSALSDCHWNDFMEKGVQWQWTSWDIFFRNLLLFRSLNFITVGCNDKNFGWMIRICGPIGNQPKAFDSVNPCSGLDHCSRTWMSSLHELLRKKMDCVLKKLTHIKLSNYHSEDKERAKKLIHKLWRSAASALRALSV